MLDLSTMDHAVNQRFGFAGLFVLASLSCELGSPGGATAVFSQRDSAGVRIVESHAPAWADGERWTLSEEPIVTIGREDGPEEYSLFQVVGALRLPDGRIVIANRGSDQLRYYDSTGTFLHSVGQDGYGPGEFKMMFGIWFARDSIIVADPGQDRISLFSASGEYGRTLMLQREPGAGSPHTLGVFADGTILGMTLIFDRAAGVGKGFQFRRNEVVLRCYSPTGDVTDSLGVFFSDESVLESFGGQTDPATGEAYGRMLISQAPFGRRASTVAHGSHVYYGSGSSYEIQVFNKAGRLERIIRRPIPNPPVTERDKELFRADWLENNGDWERRRVDELQYPETKPAYQALQVDALGNVWVAENATVDEDNVIEWTVFDTEGIMLGIVEAPGGGRIPNIGDDYYMAVWRTELDVEQLRVYRLFK
jgi:hypothetical protein